MKKRFTTTLEEGLLRDLKVQAAKEDKNVNEILEKIITEYLEKVEKEEK